jgi:tetratricopeptide (TPR) repeat protein
MRIGVLAFLIAISAHMSLALAQDSGSTVKPVNTTQQSPLKSEANTLFKRIYEHPDDLDALFRYAQVTTELGDYEAAIGALERILYFRHDLPRVQLELGALYFRLHSFPMARSYFDTVLKGKDVPEPVRRRVTAYLAAIATAEQQSKTFSAFFQTGARYQTNANAGPNGLVVRALGNDAILSSAFARKPDWNWFGQGGFRWL